MGIIPFKIYCYLNNVLSEVQLVFDDCIERLSIISEAKDTAYGSGRVSREPITFDYDDVSFIYQFPPQYWSSAIQKRYGDLLTQALKARESGKQMPQFAPSMNFSMKGGANVQFGEQAVVKALRTFKGHIDASQQGKPLYYYEESIPGGGHRIVLSANKNAIRGKAVNGIVTSDQFQRLSDIALKSVQGGGVLTRMNKLIPKLEGSLGKMTSAGSLGKYGFDFQDFLPGVGDFIPASSAGYQAMSDKTKETLFGGRKELESGMKGTSWLRGGQSGTPAKTEIYKFVKNIKGYLKNQVQEKTGHGEETFGKRLADSIKAPQSFDELERELAKLTNKLKELVGSGAISDQLSDNITDWMDEELNHLENKLKDVASQVIPSGRPERFSKENLKQIITHLSREDIPSEEKERLIPKLDPSWYDAIAKSEVVPKNEKDRLLPDNWEEILQTTGTLVPQKAPPTQGLHSKLLPRWKRAKLEWTEASMPDRGVFTDPTLTYKGPEDWRVRSKLEPAGVHPGAFHGLPWYPPDATKQEKEIEDLRTAKIVKPSQIRTSRALYGRAAPYEQEIKKQVQTIMNDPNLSPEEKKAKIVQMRENAKEITVAEVKAIFNSQMDRDQKWAKMKELALSRGVTEQEYNSAFSPTVKAQDVEQSLNQLAQLKGEEHIDFKERIIKDLTNKSGATVTQIQGIINAPKLDAKTKAYKIQEISSPDEKGSLRKIIWLSKTDDPLTRWQRTVPRALRRGEEKFDPQSILAILRSEESGAIKFQKISDQVKKYGINPEDIKDIFYSNKPDEQKAEEISKLTKTPWSVKQWSGIGLVKTFDKTYSYVVNDKLYIDMNVPIPLLEPGKVVNPTGKQPQIYGGFKPGHEQERATPLHPKFRDEPQMTLNQFSQSQINRLQKDEDLSEETKKMISKIERILGDNAIDTPAKKELLDKLGETKAQKEFIQNITKIILDKSFTQDSRHKAFKNIEVNLLKKRIANIQNDTNSSDEEKIEKIKSIEGTGVFPTLEEKRREELFMRRMGFTKKLIGNETLWKHELNGTDYVDKGIDQFLEFLKKKMPNEGEPERSALDSLREMIYRATIDYIQKNAREPALPDIVLPGKKETRPIGVGGEQRSTRLGAQLSRKVGKKIAARLKGVKNEQGMTKISTDLGVPVDMVRDIAAVINQPLDQNQKNKRIEEIEQDYFMSDLGQEGEAEAKKVNKRIEKFIQNSAKDMTQKYWQQDIAGRGTRRKRAFLRALQLRDDEERSNTLANFATKGYERGRGSYVPKVSGKEMTSAVKRGGFKDLHDLDKDIVGTAREPGERTFKTGEMEWAYKKENKNFALAMHAMRKAYQEYEKILTKARQEKDHERIIMYTKMKEQILHEVTRLMKIAMKLKPELKGEIQAISDTDAKDAAIKELMKKTWLKSPSEEEDHEEKEDVREESPEQFSTIAREAEQTNAYYQNMADLLDDEEDGVEPWQSDNGKSVQQVMKLINQEGMEQYKDAFVGALYHYFEDKISSKGLLVDENVLNNIEEFIQITNGNNTVLRVLTEAIISSVRNMVRKSDDIDYLSKFKSKINALVSIIGTYNNEMANGIKKAVIETMKRAKGA